MQSAYTDNILIICIDKVHAHTMQTPALALKMLCTVAAAEKIGAASEVRACVQTRYN